MAYLVIIMACFMRLTGRKVHDCCLPGSGKEDWGAFLTRRGWCAATADPRAVVSLEQKDVLQTSLSLSLCPYGAAPNAFRTDAKAPKPCSFGERSDTRVHNNRRFCTKVRPYLLPRPPFELGCLPSLGNLRLSNQASSTPSPTSGLARPLKRTTHPFLPSMLVNLP